jgi:hypothetical protein
MQQHCIGINGSFFNTHRMLGQYFFNAYFPQMSEEEAIPLATDLISTVRTGAPVQADSELANVPALQ